MKNVHRSVSGLFTSNVLAILLLMVGVLGSVNQRVVSVQAQGQSDTCPKDAPWVKVDNNNTEEGDTDPSDEVITYTGSDVITEVCVKGGQDIVYFTADGDNGCWQVAGIGTNTVTVTKIGDGRECKDISHASFLMNSVDPSPTPTPTPEVTPTPTPEVTPTPTPTPDPGDGGDGGDDNNDDNNDNGSGGTSAPAPQGQVLGTTYAATGVVEDVIMNVLGLSGAAFTTAGSVLYGKKKASVK